jgi:hypothetical protein
MLRIDQHSFGTMPPVFSHFISNELIYSTRFREAKGWFIILPAADVRQHGRYSEVA